MIQDIVSVGSCAVDVFIKTDTKKKKGELCYPIGAKILASDLHFFTGGGGSNSSSGFSKMGLKTGLISNVGSGYNAQIILDELKKFKVDFLGVKKGMTAYSVVLDSEAKNRTILVYKGDGNSLNIKDISLNKIKTSWFYFSAMLGESFEVQKKLAKFAKKKGIKIAFNTTTYQAKKGLRFVRPILKAANVLVLNKEEADYLVGKKDHLKKLYKLGPRIICITDGVNGCKAYDGLQEYEIRGRKGVRCIETTGAGDAFSAGFVSAIIKGLGVEEAIKIGSANAESVIGHVGAKEKLLSWDEAIKKGKGIKVKHVKKNS